MDSNHVADGEAQLRIRTRTAANRPDTSAYTRVRRTVSSPPVSVNAGDNSTRNSPYFQVALHACGIVLAVLIVVVLYTLWNVLSAFQEPLLWAWLCSIALKDLKQALVHVGQKELNNRTLPLCCLRLLFFPLVIAWDTYSEACRNLQDKYDAWQQGAQIFDPGSPAPPLVLAGQQQQGQQQGQQQDQQQGAQQGQQAQLAFSTLAESPSLSDWTSTPAGFAANGTNGTAHADASSSRQPRPRGRKGKSGKGPKRPKTWWQQVELQVKSGYTWWRLTLLEFLRWLRQAAGLAPAAITSGRIKPSTPLFRLLLRCIVLYQSWRWFLMLWRTHSLLVPLLGTSVALAAGGIPFLFHRWANNSTTPPGTPQRRASSGAGALGQGAASGVVHSWWCKVLAWLSSVDRRVRGWLAAKLDSLVSLVLIVGLVLGTVLLSVVLVLQVGDESRSFLVNLQSAVAQQAPQADLSGVWGLLEAQQEQAARLLGDALPGMSALVEDRVGGFLREHNLTHLVKDVEAVYFSLSTAGDCSERLRQQLAAEVAAASLAAGEAADARSALRAQLDKAEQKLGTVVTAWEVEWLAGIKAEMANGSGVAGALGSVAKPGWGAWASRMRSSAGNSSSGGSNSSSNSSSSTATTWDGGRAKRKLEQQLVALQAEVTSATAKYAAAARDAEGARELLGSCERKYASCHPQDTAGSAISMQSPVLRRLQQASSHLSRLALLDAASELQELPSELLAQLRSSDASAWGLLTAAASPLLALSSSLASFLFLGVGSTTSLVLETSIALLRVGLGLIKLAVQAMVWATVLFYLLAMGNDPVAGCLELLPISGHARAKASETITNAMRGVFVSSLKLSVFHALFSWLTLSMAGCHFVYLLTALSAVVAILPLIPVWLIAIPAALELALVKEEFLRGLVLVGVHIGAYNYADDLILREIEASQPYLTGLGIFGGMYTFASPLQGVLLGPMLLALLSVGHNLHREFLRS